MKIRVTHLILLMFLSLEIIQGQEFRAENILQPGKY